MENGLHDEDKESVPMGDEQLPYLRKMEPRKRVSERTKPFRTKDGSLTLFDLEFEESYHSGNGAISESLHVFIDRGFHAPGMRKAEEQAPLHILEVGFGTGINALLTLHEVEKGYGPVLYETLEPFPVDESIIEPFARDIEDPTPFRDLHGTPWDSEKHRITDRFELLKHPVPLEDFQGHSTVDLILYDAFGGHVQPEMWESPILDCALTLGAPGSIFVTYASKGSLKRSLKHRGWDVESLEGALGKREMVRARYPLR
jgi:hypothetical protein